MVNNLKSCALIMYQLFTALKEHLVDQPIMEDEISIASGKKVLNSMQAKIYCKNLLRTFILLGNRHRMLWQVHTFISNF